MKLEINHRKRNEKKPTTWRLNNLPIKKQWVNEEMEKKLKNTLRQMIMKAQHSESMGCCKSSAQREIHSNTDFPQQRRKMSNRQLNPPPK